ncbi:MAG: CopD family protein [Gammaproteobacteria bacterium]|tara:strand:+ start:161 stop:583 length:423 start_codon:yes stop_codon:yes gene_type:complete
MIFLIIKTIHIISVIAWMAALFYLPRLFVYHAKHNNEKYLDSVFKIMESKLLGVIANPALVIVWLSGISLIYYLGIQPWLIIKMIFVFLMTLFHLFLFFALKKFENNLNNYSERFYRIINEVPTLLLVIIIVLVVFQPEI